MKTSYFRYQVSSIILHLETFFPIEKGKLQNYSHLTLNRSTRVATILHYSE